MVTKNIDPKKVIFWTEKVTCDIPQKAYFFVYPIKREICYLVQKITYGNIRRIILHVIRIYDFGEHISVLVTKTKHMPTP